jgi:hypothetical protein
MNASLMAVLTDAELLLINETEPAALADLDEDGALELEARIRRARDKYTGQYRRAASARVPEQGGRGKARPMNRRSAMKAEAFETALARSSRRVAVLARESAARLRAERLEAARAAKTAGAASRSAARPATRADRKGPAARPRAAAHRALRTPASEKERAGTQAAGARRQVRRDTKRAAAR